MNVVETMALANQLEVNLDVNGEAEKVVATPRERITDDLRAGIRENRDELMRNLLIWKATSFLSSTLLGERSYWEATISEDLADAYNDASFVEFRRALRRWTQEILKSQTFKSEEEVRQAFVAARDERGWTEVA